MKQGTECRNFARLFIPNLCKYVSCLCRYPFQRESKRLPTAKHVIHCMRIIRNVSRQMFSLLSCSLTQLQERERNQCRRCAEMLSLARLQTVDADRWQEVLPHPVPSVARQWIGNQLTELTCLHTSTHLRFFHHHPHFP